VPPVTFSFLQASAILAESIAAWTPFPLFDINLATHCVAFPSQFVHKLSIQTSQYHPIAEVCSFSRFGHYFS
jgi:hypothetical protein